MSIKEQIKTDQKQWYAATCKYLCEKRLSDEFEGRGITTYVPLKKTLKALKAGRKEVVKPLIHSHIFVYIDRSEYIDVISHPHVFQFLNFSGKIIPIPVDEMDMMKRVVGEAEDVAYSNQAFEKGDRVEIIHGDLTGLKGILTKKENFNFTVVLETLGMGLSISVDPRHMIKIGSAKLVA